MKPHAVPLSASAARTLMQARVRTFGDQNVQDRQYQQLSTLDLYERIKTKTQRIRTMTDQFIDLYVQNMKPSQDELDRLAALQASLDTCIALYITRMDDRA